jgi:hypothetical protein
MGTCSPLFRTRRQGVRQMPEPWKEKRTPWTSSSWRTAHLYEERTAVRQPPFLSPAPQPSRCRDTTSCVRVGRLSTLIRRVKKHRCHNRSAETPRYFNRLSHFVLQEGGVNTAAFDRCRNRAGHNILCPPPAHRVPTSRPQVALKKRPDLGAERRFSTHLNRLSRSANRVPCEFRACPGS